MKKQLVFLFLWILVSGVTVFAQDTLKVNVPFDFVVAEKTLPAGEYHFVSYGSNGIVRIRDFQTHFSIYTLSDYTQRMTISEVTTEWMAVPEETNELVNTLQPAATASGYNSAVFNKYGDKYFLSTMWLGFSGRTFPAGNMEQQVKSADLIGNQEAVVLVATRVK